MIILRVMVVANKLLKRLIIRIRMTVISRWQRFWIGICWSMTTGRMIVPTAIEQWNISGSSTVPTKEFDLMRVAQNRWEEAERLQRYGKYHRAVKIREEILSELYDFQGISNSDYFPPILGTTWSSNFGHLSLIGHHKLAQHLGIIPKGSRIILDNNYTANPELFREVCRGDSTVRQISGTRWSDMPTFWHLSERLRSIKTRDGFVDTSKLIDETFSEKNLLSLDGNYFKLSGEYSETSAIKLELYGLPKLAKFVTIHIREGGPIGDPGTQPISSFIPAIKEITRNGYWVIRIGDRSMAKLPDMNKVIDLVPKNNFGQELHTYALARCEFFVGTASGPSWIPRIFGVPSLITNLYSVGTQVGRAPQGSIHIPKKYVTTKGKMLSLAQLFKYDLAFSSPMTYELTRKGINLESNTSDEILESTKEIIDTLKGAKKEPSVFNEIIDSIRRIYDPPAWGNFSESFISKNPEWLNQD
jgi:putative glycosyltransferase (TIGR04372 family)